MVKLDDRKWKVERCQVNAEGRIKGKLSRVKMWRAAWKLTQVCIQYIRSLSPPHALSRVRVGLYHVIFTFEIPQFSSDLFHTSDAML